MTGTEHHQRAYQNLITASGLDDMALNHALSKACQHVIDFAELYFEDCIDETWMLDEGIVKSANVNHSRGLGVRVIQSEQVGFAYADTISNDALQQAVSTAGSMAKHAKQPIHLSPLKVVNYMPMYQPLMPVELMKEADKVAWLQEVDRYVRSKDPRVIRVNVALSGSCTHMFVTATDGTFVGDVRPMVRLNVSVIVESNGKREQGYSGFGGRYDYEQLQSGWQRCADQAVAAAMHNLEARPSPAGNMTVVMGSGWPGVLLHEAVGHGLEGDFNRRGSSSFHNLIGKPVASPQCTIIDEGCMPNRRGSLSVDDEGTPTQQTVLIENGVLKQYLFDKHNARLMGQQSTGNGRRESYACLPLPRMTNTYMMPGKYTHDEIVASVKNGIYAANFSGGQVDITSGKFVFVVNEAYLIENGKLTAPIKGATLIGDGPSSLQKISMVGDNMAIDEGVGICGKDGQSVPVGVGQPSLRLDEIIVGGTG